MEARDEIETVSEPVVLHVLPVGGGMLALSPVPGAGGDYRGDLEHLASWRPAFVISVVTEAELAEAGALHLGQWVQDRGTRFLHLPVRAGAAPSAELGKKWAAARDQVRRALIGGGRVMINSRGGDGRAGMLALRLMIEAGEAPDEAEDRLRAVHDAAIGTREQMAWALAAERDPATFVRHKG